MVRLSPFTDIAFQPNGAGSATQLQDLPEFFFEIADGFPDSTPDVSGRDEALVGSDGMWTRPRRLRAMPIMLKGWVGGDGATEAAQRSDAATNRTALRDLFDPTAGIGTLTCVGDDGTAWIIQAQPEVCLPDADPKAPTHWDYTIRLIAIGYWAEGS